MKEKRQKSKILARSSLMSQTKGELTTQQIIILIIAITSFVVILFLLFRLNLGETTDKELCHNSVIMKGKSGLTEKIIPLNCHTNYICITEDGTCEQMTNPDIKKVQTPDEIYRILADEMADCWWMFGEGKVNYVQKDLTGKLYCSICSQVAFDVSVKENIFDAGEIDKKEFYNYLKNEKISGKDKTYLEYLYKTQDLSEIWKEDFGKINLDKQYYVMMGITSKISTLGWIGVGTAIGAGATFFLTLSPITIPGGIIATIVMGAVVGGTGGIFVAPILEGESGNEYLSPTIIEVNSEQFNELKCSSIKTLA